MCFIWILSANFLLLMLWILFDLSKSKSNLFVFFKGSTIHIADSSSTISYHALLYLLLLNEKINESNKSSSKKFSLQISRLTDYGLWVNPFWNNEDENPNVVNGESRLKFLPPPPGQKPPKAYVGWCCNIGVVIVGDMTHMAGSSGGCAHPLCKMLHSLYKF